MEALPTAETLVRSEPGSRAFASSIRFQLEKNNAFRTGGYPVYGVCGSVDWPYRHGNATLCHHGHQIPITQFVAEVPTNAPHHDLLIEVPACRLKMGEATGEG
jgi:hypothetical protein